MIKKKSIKTKVTNLILLVSVIAILLVSAVSIVGILNMRESTTGISSNLGEQAADGSEDALKSLALNQLMSLTKSKAIYADTKLNAVRSRTMMISDIAENIIKEPDKYSDIPVSAPLAGNKGVVSSQLLYAENASLDFMPKMGNLVNVLDSMVKEHSEVFCAEIGTEDGYIIVSDTDSDTKANMGFFDVRERSWYTGAKAAKELTWSSLVDDSYGRGLGIVCTDPIFDNNGDFFGVAGVSMLLTELSDTISNEDLGETSYAFVIDSEGNTVIMPGMTSLSQSINLLTDANEQSVKDMAQKMISGESGVAQVTLYGKEVYAAYTPLNSINWSICTVIGVDEILRPALLNDEEISKYTSLAVREIDSAIFFMMIIIVVIIAASLIIITILASTFSKKLTEPIVELTDMAQKIGEGDLTCKAEIKTGDEIEVLSDTLGAMTEQLSGYIENITAITAEKERMGAELDIAAKIQESELPRKFPAFPDRQEFDIHALMTPAKEVGGDFYDFFLVDKDHLAVVIADVSGKGIPAAMFMMSAKTHIKTNASIGKSPADILSATNDELCSGNDAEMFVTAFVGILELSTGRFVYANAGHNPPLLKRGNGKYEWLKIRPGFVLAGMPGIRYRQAELYFGKDDMLFMYTDGVTEAADVNEELFGNDRLEQALNEHLDASPKQIVGKILKKIVKFEEGADQADDITMVALQYFSPQKKDQYEINLPAEKLQLQLLLDKVDALLEQHDCNPKAQYQVDVCIEEIFVNIASYAYGGKPGPARVTCEFENTDDGGEQIIITFCDDGVPYNPLNREAPDITLDAEEREIGGLGIFMTQKMMDKTEYEYKGENIFRMYKKIN